MRDQKCRLSVGQSKDRKGDSYQPAVNALRTIGVQATRLRVSGPLWVSSSRISSLKCERNAAGISRETDEYCKEINQTYASKPKVTKPINAAGGHNEGSRKSKVHQLFDTQGAEAAWVLGLKLKLKDGTLRSWFAAWKPLQNNGQTSRKPATTSAHLGGSKSRVGDKAIERTALMCQVSALVEPRGQRGQFLYRHDRKGSAL